MALMDPVTHEWRDTAHLPSHRVLLIDSDIVAFKIASVNQTDIDWGNGVTTRTTEEENAKLQAIRYIEQLKEDLNAAHVVICLTDKENFRKSVYPQYKSNRAGVEKPELLQVIKDHLCDHYENYIRPGLEADDCMGILSTMKTFMYGKKKIIVSEDKDMQTIPGYLFNPAKDRKVRLITKEQADYYHLYQTLIGDTTDGYPGCPGVGPKIAEEFLKGGLKYEPFKHVFSMGPRKGMSEIRYDKVDSMYPWETVVSLFEKAGLTEDDALQQARVARICRAEDFNFKEKKVILWCP